MTSPEAHYKVVAFTHANLKRPVNVVAGTLSYFLWSDQVKAMIIFKTGGGQFPVSETEDEIKEKINQLSKGEK